VSYQSPNRRAGSPPTARRTVLVAGGSDWQRGHVAGRLAAHGYAVETATDAGAALSALVMHAPDAVVLCDEAPGFDAGEVCRRIRAHAGSRHTPLALLLAPDAEMPIGPTVDADVLPADTSAGALVTWLDARLPPAASAADWLRLTLAQQTTPGTAPVTSGDGPGDAASDGMTDVTWRLLFEHLGDGAAIVEHDGRIRVANPALAQLFGLASADACAGRHLLDLLPDASTVTTVAGTVGPPTLATTIRTADGPPIPLDLQFMAAGRGAGAPVFMTVRDQRWRQAAEEARRDNHDLAEQLRRSQKIGALGRLAGGVAHDFNNLLQVIGGYAEALGVDSLDRPSRRRLLRRIQRATDRAASLTRQLLAFGRRQVLVPQVLDLNVTVLSLEHMLVRVIGEDVQFVSSLAPDLQRVKVDPGQIEQVVLNLALNARDAMADGGTLEIATANFALPDSWTHPALPVTVPAGGWVLLSVLDSGSGMDNETAAQAFEPFFTTKDASRGSGLGLSMVYGIVKQSGGYTWIETAPGAGTSVHVLLPAVDEEIAAPHREDPAGPTRPDGSGGVVLLVEDDPEVRSLFSAFLRDGGYQVVEASDGQEALEAFERQAEAIDVVMTDVVMPNVSGPALASALRARRPEVKVLYVSGYTEQLELGGPEPNTTHLSKPVTRGALLKHLALLLGTAEPGA